MDGFIMAGWIKSTVCWMWQNPVTAHFFVCVWSLKLQKVENLWFKQQCYVFNILTLQHEHLNLFTLLSIIKIVFFQLKFNLTVKCCYIQMNVIPCAMIYCSSFLFFIKYSMSTIFALLKLGDSWWLCDLPVCRECILKTAKALVEDTKLLVSGAGASQEKLAQAAQSSVCTITKLADVVKLGAASLGSEDPETQVWTAELSENNVACFSAVCVFTITLCRPDPQCLKGKT